MKPKLCIGDTQNAHGQLAFVSKLPELFPNHELWFLGDTLDSYTSKPVEQVQTLTKILAYVESRAAQCVWSNHDAGYAMPALNGWCSGWNASTAAMVCSGPLAERMRKAFQGCIYDDDLGVLVTHAGVSVRWLHEIAQSQDKLAIPDGLNEMARHTESPYFWVGRARGGSSPTGGPLWCDWDHEFQLPALALMQIVGHTHGPSVRYLGDSLDGAINIDCLGEGGKNVCLEITEGPSFKQVAV